MYHSIKKDYGMIEIVPLNGIAYIETFLIYVKYRGKGYARKLARLLPKKCWLTCYPLYGKKALTFDILKRFYISLGFKFYTDPNNKLEYGFKGTRPSINFWNRLPKII